MNNENDIMKMLGPVLDTFNQQLIGNSILTSSLIKVLVDKGIITDDEIKKEADKIQQEILNKTQEVIKKQNDSKIITPDIQNIKKKIKK